MANNMTAVYLHVVDDVIKNIRTEFQSEGIDETVLQELQTLWELKMMQSGAVAAPPSDLDVNSAGGVDHHATMPSHDGSLSYKPRDVYNNNNSSARSYFPTGRTHELPAQQQTNLYSSLVKETKPEQTLKPALGRPQPFMPKPELWDSRTQFADMDNAFLHSSQTAFGGQSEQGFSSIDPKRRRMGDPSFIPQADGAHDEGCQVAREGVPESEEELLRGLQLWEAAKARRKKWEEDGGVGEESDAAIGRMIAGNSSSGALIPQVDGGADEEENEDALDGPRLPGGDEEEEEEEDYNEAGPLSDVGVDGLTAHDKSKEDDDDDSLLSEDDDDSDLEKKNADDADPVTDNLVLATYDKVGRVKSKWKCVLKDCIMHLNGRDTLAVKANGEFDF